MITRIATITTLFVLCALTGLPVHAQTLQGYETPPVRKASEVLPPSLIEGEHFKVRDEVTWKEGLHVFAVDSTFGEFTVWGEPMLRVRLQEVEALYTLKHTSSATVGTKAAGRAVTSSFRSLGKAFAHPIKTTKALPGGIKRMFKSVKYDAQDLGSAGKAVVKEQRSGGPAPGESSQAAQAGSALGKQLVGIDSAYRKWSEQAGVNPYTTNAELRAELERVAKVEAGSRIGTKIFAPSIIPEELKVITDVAKTAYHKEWREIIEDNIKAMASMKVSPEDKARYLENPYINLTISTLIVELLERMEGVADRSIVIHQASLLNSEAESAFFAESLMMVHWFHFNESPAVRMLGGTLIPVLLTSDNRLVACAASDFEYWTRDTQPIADEFTRQYNHISPKREVWVADNVSAGYVRGVSNLGWSVRSDLRAKVLPEIPWGLQDEGQ